VLVAGHCKCEISAGCMLSSLEQLRNSILLLQNTFVVYCWAQIAQSLCGFYVQRLLGEHDEVHLSALGMAVSTMVSIVEILKKDGLAVETSELTREHMQLKAQQCTARGLWCSQHRQLKHHATARATSHSLVSRSVRLPA
jgi:hypothetical protein